MALKLSNNAISVLAGAISSGAQTIALRAGDGALFPVLGAGDYHFATIVDANGLLEIVRVTARSGDVLTVTRAHEGTIARSFDAGCLIELRLTAGTLEEVIDIANDAAAVAETVVGYVDYKEPVTETKSTFTVGYPIGRENVWLNGVKLERDYDYIAVDGNTITLTEAATAGDTFALTAYGGFKGDKGDNGEGVAAGGTTGQYLKKKSGTDYDTEWASFDEPKSPTFTYTGGLPTSVSYATGQSKTITYSGGVPTQVDYVSNGITHRKTITYNADGTIAGILETTL